MAWQFTQDLSDAFFERARAVTAELRADLVDVLGVSYAESGLHADVPNHLGSNASGLLQWMPDVLAGMGWTQGPDEFRRLDAASQVPYVRKFLWPYRAQLTNVAGVYLAVFMPADVGHHDESDFVISAKGGRRGWAYSMNVSLDANGDQRITVDELAQAVRRNCVGSRWNEVLLRAKAQQTWVAAVPEAVEADLGTTYGVQSALVKLGYRLVRDNIPGPKTTAALQTFQTKYGIPRTGYPGPVTRAKLAALLAA